MQIAIAHARLETIHPFVDGNGRNGRALVHALLRGKGVVRSTTAPLSEGLPKNTNRYFGALRSYRAGGAGPICEQFAVASRFAAHPDAGLIDKPGLEPDAARGALAGLRPRAMGWALPPHLVSHPVMDAELFTGLLGTSQTSALTCAGPAPGCRCCRGALVIQAKPCVSARRDPGCPRRLRRGTAAGLKSGVTGFGGGAPAPGPIRPAWLTGTRSSREPVSVPCCADRARREDPPS
ncbi:Fic family protein [Arthrobacter sp. AQ5-05]|uniref:Fic family protein n=1 Tax=Arthrobacter sp. AQ5-05 TaxID=2184581 RepID=UPI0025710B25|nr:Fic family protein [Arthrobacter sp. AQ5-05]